MDALYPNPTNTSNLVANIYAPENIEAQLVIYSQLGQVLVSKNIHFEKGENQYQLAQEIQNFADGTYFVQFETIKGLSLSEKIVVMK